MDKQHLRDHFKSLRAALAARPEEHTRRSLAVCATLAASALWQEATHIFAYYPVRGEVDTLHLIQLAHLEGKTLLLPRCLAQQPGCMEMVTCSCMEDLVPAAYGIPEPGPHLPPSSGPWPSGGLVLAPGLAFDRTRFRLGYGGGYYDRFFAAHPHLQSVGLGFNFQMVDTLPHETWDIPLTHICSEDSLC